MARRDPLRWRRLLLRLVVVLLALVVVGVAGVAGWLAMGDDADPVAWADARERYDVTVTDEGGILAIRPADPSGDLAVAFLPGARIERGSYVATWAPIVERTGVPVFIPGVPLNLPVLGGDHVERVRDANPEIARWVVGGHSMGGFAAAGDLAGGVDDDVAGLLLWAAGPGREDLGDLDLPTLVVAGAADQVVPLGMIRRGLPGLPPGHRLVVIDGMTHGQFGRYREDDDPDRRPDAVTLAELTEVTAGFLTAVEAG